MIETVSINFRRHDEESFPVIKELIDFIKSHNRKVRIRENSGEYFCGGTGCLCDDENFLSSELAIVVGGDGTFLTAARFFADADIPIFGINRGKLGFLTEFSPEEYRKFLPFVFDGSLSYTERLMLEAVQLRDGREINRISFLNDAVLSKGAFSRVINIEVEVDGNPVNSFRGDGLIVSTPTGSTAYSLSAGGPVIVPYNANVYLINPVCPHTLGMRPMIVPANSTVKASILSEVDNLLLTIDGQEGIRINCRDEIQIKMSNRKVKLINHPEKNFYSILKEKLHWG